MLGRLCLGLFYCPFPVERMFDILTAFESLSEGFLKGLSKKKSMYEESFLVMNNVYSSSESKTNIFKASLVPLLCHKCFISAAGTRQGFRCISKGRFSFSQFNADILLKVLSASHTFCLRGLVWTTLTSPSLIPGKSRWQRFPTEANTTCPSSVLSTDRSNPVFPVWVLGYTGQNEQTQCLKFGTEVLSFSEVREWAHLVFNDLKSQFRHLNVSL